MAELSLQAAIIAKQIDIFHALAADGLNHHHRLAELRFAETESALFDHLRCESMSYG